MPRWRALAALLRHYSLDKLLIVRLLCGNCPVIVRY